MPKALPGPDDVEDGVIIGETEDISGIAEDIDSQLTKITSEFGADKHDVKFTVKVYRIVENRGELAWLFDCTPSELPIMQRLRDEYDGGRFEVRIYRNNRIFKRIPVLIEKSKTSIKPVDSKSEVAQLVEALAQQQQNQLNQLKEMILQVSGKEKPTSFLDALPQIMTVLASMKEFIAPQQNNSMSPDKMMELFFKGMEFASEREGGTTMMDLAKSFIQSPLLEGALKQQAHLPQPIPRQFPNAQMPTPKKPVQQNPRPQNKGVNTLNPAIAGYVNFLLNKAKAGADPALYADLVLDNLPENIIEEKILNDNLIEQLCLVNPEISDYKDWFKQLQEEIKKALTDEEETNHNSEDENSSTQSPNDTGRPNGNKGDS